MQRKSYMHRTSLSSVGTAKGNRTPLKKVNPERQAKRRKAYAKKLAAYKRSETFKVVEARAGGCCERRFTLLGNPAMCGNGVANDIPLHHHHTTYARFGGDELPEDMIVLCQYHHDEAEGQKMAGNRVTRAKQH